MFERVLAVDSQYLTDVDLTRMGTFPQEGVETLIRSLLISGRLYKDFGVLANGLNKIDVAPGTVFDTGVMYHSDGEQAKSVQEYIPFEAAKKVVVTLIGQGRSAPGYRESRTMEREVAQSGGGTTTQLVPEVDYRVQVNDVVLSFIAGGVSTSPTAAPTPLNTVAICDILIGTGGIEQITRRSESEAPELDDLARSLTAVSATLAIFQQEITGLRNDLAAAFRSIEALGSRTVIDSLTNDVAQIKDRLDMPDTGSPYGADRFLDTSETDLANVDYYARVEEGVRFPYANFNKTVISFGTGMANSANLMHASQGFICPKYNPVDGIVIGPRAGSQPLGGTTYQTMDLGVLTMSRESTRYGPYFEVCTNSAFWNSGRYDAASGILSIGNDNYSLEDTVWDDPNQPNGLWGFHRIVRIRQIWTDTVQVPYDSYIPTTHSIQGVIKSQSFIQSQGRWTPGVRLAIETWSPGAQITATLVECDDNGFPNKKRAIAVSTLTSADFKAYTPSNNLLTRFAWDHPFWMKQGLYAIMFATTGDVTVSYAEGQSFLGGTQFDSTDGYFQQGDLTKDMVMTVEYCQFTITSIPVLLAGLNLDGGIHNVGIKVASIVPTNADSRFALQTGGSWIQLPRADKTTGVIDPDTVPDNLFGAGVTPYYDFRVELNGNQWEMPILDLNQSEVTVFRADARFRHLSVERLLQATVTSIVITAVVGAFDPARHTVTCALRYGTNYASSKAASGVQVKPVVGRDDAVMMVWTFSFSPGVDRIKVDLSGTTNNARITPHIEYDVYDA
jgi:hypothetical protein